MKNLKIASYFFSSLMLFTLCTGHLQGALIPFNNAAQTNTNEASNVQQTNPQTPVDQSQAAATNQNKVQLNSTGGGGFGTSSNASNKAEQDDLYNQQVNKMLRGE